MVASQRRHRSAAFGRLRQRVVQPVAEIVTALANSGGRTRGHLVVRIEGPGQSHLKAAGAQALQQVVQERGVQLRGLGRGKIADQARLDPSRPGRLGEQEQVTDGWGLHGRGFYMPLLTLLTDFGLDDYYVAAVKGTVLRLAPGSQIVDISHQVPPGDIETAAFLLAAAFPSFPAGTVHLAVVDPGVGSSRRILAVGIRGGSWLVAPDNGLLTPLLVDAESIHSVDRSELFLAGPGHTFHGRDRFAPVAAWLLAGGDV